MKSHTIEQCRIFLALATPSFFRDPKCRWQVEYAISLDKPIRVALEKGTPIPPRYFEGARDLTIQEWSTPQELKRVVERLVK